MTLISAINVCTQNNLQNRYLKNKQKNAVTTQKPDIGMNNPHFFGTQNKTALAFKSTEKKKLAQTLPYELSKGVFFANKMLDDMEITGEQVSIKSSGLELPAWYIPPKNDNPTVLYCHGNTTNITKIQKVAEQYTDKGLGILMIEYPGYGEAPGNPSEQGLYQSALDGATFLNDKGIENKDIIVHGYSLGGSVAAHTAAYAGKPFKALILDSTFTTMPDVMENWIDNGVLLSNIPEKVKKNPDSIKDDIKQALMPTIEHLKDVPEETKILVVHSINDELVDEAIGHKLITNVKQLRPDTITKWENITTLNSLSQNNYAPYHMDYECRMPLIFDFIEHLKR